MRRVGPGFDRFRETCEILGIDCDDSMPPSPVVPSQILAAPLEDALQRLYAAHNGMWWSTAEFSLRIYPLDGPDALEWRNEGFRRNRSDDMTPFPFDELMIFAQYGRSATYLATVPNCSDDSGSQPVVYYDESEHPWAVPIAASVDDVFSLLAAYLLRATRQSGLTGIQDAYFPYAVADLITFDRGAIGRMKNCAIQRFAGADDRSRHWIANLLSDDEAA